MHVLTVVVFVSFVPYPSRATNTTRPVVGAAYAATIKDWSLCKRALKTEFISLIVCIAIGAAVGASTG
jgi:hypothetical protein